MKQLAIAIARGAAGTADEQVMGRPWHISHLRALASHLGLSHNQYVWAKRDPTNLSQSIPESVATEMFGRYKELIKRYGFGSDRGDR